MKNPIFYRFRLLAVIVLTFIINTNVFAEVKPNPTVVLVHGAFSDGSIWSKVIPLLQVNNINVIATQIPLTSLTDDVATTQRTIDITSGPIVLVGHSYAGAVITQAGNSDKVKALVYIAAFAPEKGQSVSDLGTHLPPSPGTIGLTTDKFGFYHLSTQSLLENLAPDIPHQEALILTVTQTPTATKVFNEKVKTAAWKDKNNFYLVAKHDRMIQPDLERQFAHAMKATTVEISSSHVAMLSHPNEVAKLIIAAVEATRKEK
ncbi:alpha/beta fold hydrolase [Candidatus Berkiella aquae]|uniref:Alpha/beta hydrolase n=1 Tax=Candidatus Berkiella aquae TaxID=295108 RepID=A0A0Q9YDL0_9GAMM|nr:alpha/beta hydrolase [Candidatus Berkiella aquae]MCS5710633.1 alpha/beta hydrolase [Candidatus Berkiella aquae]